MMWIKDINIDDFVDEIDEEFDIIWVEYYSSDRKSVINEDKMNNIKHSLYLIASTLKKSCPEATIDYNSQINGDSISVKVHIQTDSGDWLETNTNTFVDCVKYATEFKITPMSDERMKIEFLFNEFMDETSQQTDE